LNFCSEFSEIKFWEERKVKVLIRYEGKACSCAELSTVSVADLQTQQTVVVRDICRSVCRLEWCKAKWFGGGTERRRRLCYSKAAIVEVQQLMDHVHISYTVDVTDTFRVAG
jgi:hypothetical protein